MRSNETNKEGNLKKANTLSNRFSELDGRQPRILITMVGEEENDLGSKVIATNFADIGFDVDISPSFLSPSNIAREAIENDVHVLAVFFLSGDTNRITLKILDELKMYEREDILVVVVGEISKEHHFLLDKKGVSGIFTIGSKNIEIGIHILDLLISYRQ